MCENEWKERLRKVDVDVDGAIQRFSNKEDRYIKYLRLFKDITSPIITNLIFQKKIVIIYIQGKRLAKIQGDRSTARTTVSKTVYLGSNPSRPAIKTKSRC